MTRLPKKAGLNKPHAAEYALPIPSLSHFIEPCLPRGTAEPGWLHEIKHDGFRIMTRRDSRGLRAQRLQFRQPVSVVVAAIASLPVRSCLIDGKAIVVDESGLSVFELLRCPRRRGDTERRSQLPAILEGLAGTIVYQHARDYTLVTRDEALGAIGATSPSCRDCSTPPARRSERGSADWMA
jgi:bifunctional non-homologous end joining protein LigD